MATTSPQDVHEAPLAPDAKLSLPERLRMVREFHVGLAQIRDAAGPVAMVRFGPARVVPPFAVVTSPQGAHDVLAPSDGAFDKEMIVHVENRRLGENVFNLPHERWTARRRTLQPLFTKKHVADYAGHMAGAAEDASADMAYTETTDLDEEMRRLTLRVVGRSVFGTDLGARSDELAPAVRTVLQWVTDRSLRPVRAPMWLPTPARHRMRRATAVINSVVDDAVQAALADPDRDAQLIRLLLAAKDPATGQPLSREAIRDELVVFLLAGHDTTSTTLTYALWALGRDPAMQDRVASEVAGRGERTLTVADVEQLPYTVQVIHEALRLCPPAPAFGRLAMKDVVVDGHRIPRGTNVVVGAYALHRDPSLWEDAERFDPDRFSRERSHGRHRWQFLPFGAGPRSCIGDHFAMLEATLGLATIVRAVRIESLEDEFPLALPFTMTAGGPIPARVTRRTGLAPATR